MESIFNHSMALGFQRRYFDVARGKSFSNAASNSKTKWPEKVGAIVTRERNNAGRGGQAMQQFFSNGRSKHSYEHYSVGRRGNL